MNDRFKFRVWDKIKNIYIKDFVFNFINKLPYITVEYFDNEYEYTHTFEEDEIIVEQCTGLKDKNGKLIYEGDIVKAFGFKDYYNLVCRFRDSSFCLDHIDGSPYNFAHSVSPVEVIGNIHENADLLENGK